MQTASPLSLALLAALLPALSAAGAPLAPTDLEVLRAVHPKFDASTHETGARGTACGTAGRLTARLSALKPWRGLGREQWVAALSVWLRKDAAPSEPGEELEYAQACGPRPGQVALLERGAAGLRVVALSRSDLREGSLDLAPYRLRPGETLIGVRGPWMNHGFGDTILTLLRVDGDQLLPVAAIPVDVEAPNLSCKGTVAMIPRGTEPADLRVTWKISGTDDEGEEKDLGTEALSWRWTGKEFAPSPEELARARRCMRH